jgi:hypothetical protein
MQAPSPHPLPRASTKKAPTPPYIVQVELRLSVESFG